MPRGPKQLHVPIDPQGLSRFLEEHVLRLYEEASDHRNHVFHLQELSHGQRITIGGAPSLVPTRSRRWLEMSLMCFVQFDTGVAGSGPTSRSAVNAILYNNGVAVTDKVFDLTVGGSAGVGWKSGTVRLDVDTHVSPSNPGKEVMEISRNTSHAWSIVVSATGGSGNAVTDITLSVTYEDFVPFNTNRRVLA